MQKQEALSVLEPHLKTLHNITYSGFYGYFKKYRDNCADHSKRSRASLIHDETILQAKKSYLCKDGIAKHIEECNREVFILDNFAILQFKKLNDQLLVENYPTEFASRFNGNEQLELKNIPSALPRLNVGYVVNQTWTEMNGIFLTSENINGFSWSFALHSNIDQIEIPEIIKSEDKLKPSTRVRRPKIGGENESSGESKAI